MNTNDSKYSPLTAQEVVNQSNLIREIIKGAMKSGTHYGHIPGAGDRNCLLKPGAEILLSAFRIAGKPEVTNLSTPTSIHYIVCLHGQHASGAYVGSGIGECSSNEDKYQWVRVKCQQEFDAAHENDRRTKWNPDGTHDLMVRSNPRNYANTILKMAKKRALVDLALTATAASEFFTQDLDDLLEPVVLDDVEPANRNSKEPKTSAKMPAASPYLDTIEKITNEEGAGWTRFDVFTGQGFKFGTFKPEVLRQAQPYAGQGVQVVIRWGKAASGHLDLFEVKEQEQSLPAINRPAGAQTTVVVQPPSRSQRLANKVQPVNGNGLA